MKRRLTPQQQERLIAGAPFADGGDLDEIAAFIRALPAAIAAEPDPVLSAGLVKHLADVARTSKARIDVGSAPTTALAGSRRLLPRRALVARIAVAVALIPVLFAGLAFAGVTVPEPARQVFDDVGVTLPNQPKDEDSTPAGESGEGNGGASETAPNGKAKAKGKNGQPGKSGESHGKALGKGKNKGNGNAGGSNGNAGGNSGNAPGHTGSAGSQGNSGSRGSSGAAHAKKQAPVSNGQAKGHGK